VTTATEIWLTRTELAERLKIAPATCAQWASRGVGPRYAIFGKFARYRLADVLDWEEQQFGGGDAA
jgi:hypothetical protein